MSDEAAFAVFVRAHSRSFFGTAYLLTASGLDAEELLQDTLAALYPKWDRVMAADSQGARKAAAPRGEGPQASESSPLGPSDPQPITFCTSSGIASI